MGTDDRTLVMVDKRDEDGRMWRAVTLSEEGKLMIEGRDVGPGVERAWGTQTYEFEHHYSVAETASLAALLGVPEGGDLLGAIGARFTNTHELEEFLSANDIPGNFDSWMD